VTDLLKGASRSYRKTKYHEEALLRLRKSLNADDDGAPFVGGDGSTHQKLVLKNALKAQHLDEGERAVLMQHLCAAASDIVMCVTNQCSRCSRSMDSGFVSAIYNIRKEEFALSVEINRKCGIWSWPTLAVETRTPTIAQASSPGMRAQLYSGQTQSPFSRPAMKKLAGVLLARSNQETQQQVIIK
jgi:hypothetical protein